MKLRHAFFAVGVVLLTAFWWRHGVESPHLTADGAAYWATRSGPLYEYPWLNEATGGPVPYVYSPAFAHAIRPLTLLPLPEFMAVWVGLNLVALGWLIGPLPAALLAWMVPAVGMTNLWAGAVYPLMAVALALSLRHPHAWAAQALTKVTPGVGVVWHLVRREWRALAVASATTAGIVLISFALEPAAWVEWGELLRDAARRGAQTPGALPLPLGIRLVAAAAIIGVAAWRDWRWLLPLGVMISMPQVGWSTTVILLAAPRLAGWSMTEWRRAR